MQIMQKRLLLKLLLKRKRVILQIYAPATNQAVSPKSACAEYQVSVKIAAQTRCIVLHIQKLQNCCLSLSGFHGRVCVPDEIYILLTSLVRVIDSWVPRDALEVPWYEANAYLLMPDTSISSVWLWATKNAPKFSLYVRKRRFVIRIHRFNLNATDKRLNECALFIHGSRN